jgi:hypothetical protein
MCTITIDSDTLSDYFNDECEVEITSFSWSQYDNKPDVETDVRCRNDLILDMDDYVDIETYAEVVDDLELARANWELAEGESEATIKELNGVINDMTDQNNALQAELDLLKIQLALVQGAKPWYKF